MLSFYELPRYVILFFFLFFFYCAVWDIWRYQEVSGWWAAKGIRWLCEMGQNAVPRVLSQHNPATTLQLSERSGEDWCFSSLQASMHWARVFALNAKTIHKMYWPNFFLCFWMLSYRHELCILFTGNKLRAAVLVRPKKVPTSSGVWSSWGKVHTGWSVHFISVS